MGEIAVRQAILHALVASGIVEAILHAWGIRRPEARLRFWLLALAFPFLVLPLLVVVAPFRSTDRFAAGWALFASQRWNSVTAAGIGVDTLVFGLLVIGSLLLFLRDFVPFLVAAVRERRDEQLPGAVPSQELATLLHDVARRVGTRVSSTVVARTDTPILFVHGLLRQTLVISDGVLARLSTRELDAALAHELAHVRFRDPLAGWALMAARLGMFWNPAVQLVARAIVQEMEHRADGIAARATDAQTFAAALEKLAALPEPARLKPCPAGGPGRGFSPADTRRRIEIVTERLRHAHIAARVSSVLAPAPAHRFGRVKLAAVGAAIAVLVFFVV